MSLAWKPATLISAALLFTATASAQAPWLNMVNETSSRLVPFNFRFNPFFANNYRVHFCLV